MQSLQKLLLETYRKERYMWRFKVRNIYFYNIYYSCEGTYSFIGNGVGKGKKITYAEAWKGIPFY
jgi:hypothetical protein